MRDMIRLGQAEPVRKRISDVTSTLLGDTIVLSDSDWRDSTRLPGWSRAHVATHLSRGADALRRVVTEASDGRSVPLYPGEAEHRAEIERGSERTGLELQIDLDTSAGALGDAFAHVTDWLTPVSLPLGTMPVSAVAVARLHEVVLHHVDLGTSFDFHDIDPVTASWLLQWACLWLGTRSGTPTVRLVSDSGLVQELGAPEAARTVKGSDVALWAWITGRADGDQLDGADGLAWPLLG